MPSFSDSNYLFVDGEIEENAFIRDFKKKFGDFYAKQQTKK